jgi:tRNA U34 5-methylaminomethyl-2-thiouridine-forming methyltransferase MnmC
MAGLEIITTADGSHTLRNNELDETYHSVHGAVQESMHVFIRNGLDFFCNSNMRETISILEIGFGTGLNALLASQYALQKKVGVSYTTLEPFPLPQDVWSKLNYGDNDRRHFEIIHETSWNVLQPVSTNFSILKLKVSLQEAELTEKHDVIFFDAFASSVQPELWVFDSLKKVTGAMKGNGVFVTYSAKGQLKRDLKTLGLTVETLPGPPGKTEMVRATKPLVGN